MPDWRYSSLGRELVEDLETSPLIADLSQHLSCVDTTGAGEEHDDLPIRQFGHGLLDVQGQPADLDGECFSTLTSTRTSRPLTSVSVAGARQTGSARNGSSNMAGVQPSG